MDEYESLKHSKWECKYHNEFVALIGHLQVANKCRVASATLSAASSGPNPKPPALPGDTYTTATITCA